MKKRDKLYTVNKWNKNLFNTGGDIAKWDRLASAAYGANYGDPGYTMDTYMNDSGNNWFGISKADNPFSKGNIGNTMSSIGGAAATAAPREAFDYLDPVYHLAGGRETKVGNALSDTGVGLFKAGAQSGNGYMMLAGAAAKIGGGLINAGWGYKKNDKNINNITQNTAIARTTGNLLSSSNDSTTLLNNAGAMTSSSDFGTKDLIKGGWFTKGKARQKGQRYIDAENNALAYQNHGLTTGAEKVDNNLDSTAQSNFVYAFGGPLDYIAGGDMGAINYGFMTDYLTTKRKQAEASNKMPGISPTTNVFADGGIEIKHPGRLTRLKERTGKTEAELYNDGNPAHKKMVVFARNSRRWNKKALGGYLKGKVYDVPEEEVDKLIAAGYGVEYL